MPLYIVRNDITRMHVDAIVNAANNTLLGGGGVDGAIHRAAGPGLLEECAALGGCPTGDARITGGHDLPARHVIHTVGPIWRGGNSGEEELLRSCYRRSLELARDNLCATVAFPLISAGVYGYPRRQALKVASETITAFLMEDDAPDMTVYMVIFDRTSMDEGRRLFPDIARFIDDNYVRAHSSPRREDMRRMRALRTSSADVFPASAPAAPNDGPDDDIALPGLGLFEPHADSREASNIGNVPEPTIDACEKTPFESGLFTSLEDALHMMDESFSQMVTRLIKEKGMKNSDCYKKANLDKKLFSKINSDIHYRPRKTTALSLAIALELPIDQTKELLTKAGLALTHSEKFDIIVEYFILRGVYDIFTINEVLFEYDQPLLGGAVL